MCVSSVKLISVTLTDGQPAICNLPTKQTYSGWLIYILLQLPAHSNIMCVLLLHITIVNLMLIHNHYFRCTAEVMFPPLLFFIMFFCLPVSNFTKKRMNGFSWNFHGRQDRGQGTIWNIAGCCGNSSDSGSIFLFCGSVFVSDIMEKGVYALSWS